MPKDDDPLQFEVQVLGAPEQLQRMRPGNEPASLVNESGLTNLLQG
jgi:hypothetical protein